jgi:hypothetical protein
MPFWLGISIGAVLSLIASVIANIYSERIQNILDTFKLSRHGKRRGKSLKEYADLKQLHDGTRDKYLFLMYYEQVITSWYPLFIGTLIICVLIPLFATTPESALPHLHLFPAPLILIPVSLDIFDYRILPTLFLIIMLFSGMIALSVASLTQIRFRRRLICLLYFEEYETQIMARWKFTEAEIKAAVATSK